MHLVGGHRLASKENHSQPCPLTHNASCRIGAPCYLFGQWKASDGSERRGVWGNVENGGRPFPLSQVRWYNDGVGGPTKSEGPKGRQ